MAQAVAEARDGRHRSVSLDLLYDVPDGRWPTGSTTLEAALALEPDHLSLYALTLDDPDAEGLTGADGDHLPTTPAPVAGADGAAGARTRTAPPPSTTTPSIACADGWHGYEISNWARPGHESRHNLAYWQRRPYEAVGPGAHAFDGATRRWNAARLDGYLGGAHAADGARATAAARRLRGARPGDRGRRGGRSSACARTAASRSRPPTSRRSATASAGRSPPSCSTSTADDRVVLTTRGRLLSNELFGRLV